MVVIITDQTNEELLELNNQAKRQGKAVVGIYLTEENEDGDERVEVEFVIMSLKAAKRIEKEGLGVISDKVMD